MNLAEAKLSECQVCGYFGTPGREFHSYESCILYMADKNPGRLTDVHRSYVWQTGLNAMRDRVKREVLPGSGD